MVSVHSLKKSDQQTAAKLPQYFAAIIASMGGLMLGSSRGWTSTSEYPLVQEEQYGFPISQYDFAWIGSAMAFGCIFAAPFYGWCVAKFGRKKMMMILTAPAILGHILLTMAHSVSVMFVGRCLAGMSGGVYVVAVPLYTGEIAETHIRGALGAYFQVMITSGILTSYIVGSFVSVSMLSAVCGLMLVIYGVLLMFLPESPVYYLLQNNEEGARRSLQWLRGSHYNIDTELSIRKQNIEDMKASQLTFFEAFSTKAAIKGLIICIGLMTFRQFSGAPGIIFYNTNIFLEAGSTLSPNTQTILLGVVDLVFTLVSSTVVDKLGRRPLLIISGLGMATCTFLLGLFFFLKERTYNLESISWLPLVTLCCFVVSFSLGFGPIPLVLFGETFPRNIATHALSIISCVNSLFLFLVTLDFELLSIAIGRGNLFFIFSACTLLGVLFTHFVVIETKNKPLEQIIQELGK